MTDEEKARHLALRKERADEILAALDQFKVCGQCSSISYKRAQTCCVCGAYRFEEREEMVAKSARKWATTRSPAPLELSHAWLPE